MLNIPDSADEVVARSKADVQRELQQSNPFLKNSWLGAIVTGAANRIFDFYIQLNIAIRESFPDTATGILFIMFTFIFFAFNQTRHELFGSGTNILSNNSGLVEIGSCFCVYVIRYGIHNYMAFI